MSTEAVKAISTGCATGCGPHPGEPTPVVVPRTRPNPCSATPLCRHPPRPVFWRPDSPRRNAIATGAAPRAAHLAGNWPVCKSSRPASCPHCRPGRMAPRPPGTLPSSKRHALICDEWAKPELGSAGVRSHRRMTERLRRVDAAQHENRPHQHSQRGTAPEANAGPTRGGPYRCPRARTWRICRRAIVGSMRRALSRSPLDRSNAD